MRIEHISMWTEDLERLAHMAFATGTENGVNDLTDRLRRDGYTILDGPHRTGDGCYESVVLDPDGNRIELAA